MVYPIGVSNHSRRGPNDIFMSIPDKQKIDTKYVDNQRYGLSSTCCGDQAV